MLTGTLALLGRSLRMDARQPRGHLLRLLFAGLIFIGLIWAHATSLSFGAPGLKFFHLIAILNFGLISLAGMSFFSTAITEEKEEGTLGLLKMAGISSLAIILGKSTNRLIAVLFLLMVQFPFTLLAVTLGGVTYEQVFAVYGALLAYTAFVANLALFFSVVCRRSGNASSLTTMVLVLVLAGPPAGRGMLGNLAAQGMLRVTPAVRTSLFEALDRCDSFSVYHRIDRLLTAASPAAAIDAQGVSNLLAAAALFTLAWAAFDRFTQESDTSAPDRGPIARRTNRFWFLGAGRSTSLPFVWKDYHFLTGGHPALLTKFAAYGLVAAAIPFVVARLEGRHSWPRVGEWLMDAMLIALAIECSILAARLFHDELKWKTHSLLMLTPVSTSRIAAAKLAGASLSLLPALFFFVCGACLNPDAVSEALAEPVTWGAGATFIFFIHLTALFSLRVRWGALPLALAVLFVLYSCLLSWLSIVPLLILSSVTGSDKAAIMPIIYLGCVSVALLQYLTLLELDRAAGE